MFSNVFSKQIFLFAALAFVSCFWIPLQARADALLSSPNVSGNALFIYRNSSAGNDSYSTNRNGLDLQEAELAFYADVDPYSRLTMLLTVHPDYEPAPNPNPGNRVVQTWKVEPEELYADTLEIPGLTLRAGIFKAAFGKHNMLHTHAWPFIDAPLTQTGLLSKPGDDDGLSDIGISGAYLLPINTWFSELTLQYLRGDGNNVEFNAQTPNQGVPIAHWKNLVDLNDDLTMEIGGSYATGQNQYAAGNTSILGGDLTFRWRPSSGGKYRSWTLATEAMQRKLEQPASLISTTETGQAFVVWGQYQFAERWAGLARYDALFGQGADLAVNANALADDSTIRGSLAVVFNASEFSSFKLQVSDLNGPHGTTGIRDEKVVMLQGNYTIGAHPAHAY